MTEQMRSALKELQRLDHAIHDALHRVSSFDPQIEEVEEPAIGLESDVATTRARLQEMRLEERRLEVMSQEKRTRIGKLDERLKQVRNVREEAAVSTELDMVRRALEGDEQEALSLLDQIRRLETRLEEQEEAYGQARAEVEPRREELVAQREEAGQVLERARAERDAFAATVDESELRVYEAIRAGGRRMAVASITADGACGNCFGMIPPQLQSEIRHATSLIRCEACGVVLAAPSPEELEAEAAAAAAAEAEAEAEAADEAEAEGGEETEEIEEPEPEASAGAEDEGVADGIEGEPLLDSVQREPDAAADPDEGAAAPA